jgi:hypothetical protein
MRKTEHIALGLLAGMALAFTSGCNRPQERRDCVDEAGRIANDQNCQTVDQQRRSGYTGVLPLSLRRQLGRAYWGHGVQWRSNAGDEKRQ